MTPATLKASRELYWLCDSGSPSPQEAEALIAAGADLDININGFTPLIAASRRGHASIVGLLVAHGARLETPCSATGMTALMHAAHADQPACLRLLLAHGADPAWKSFMDLTAEGHARHNNSTQALAVFAARARRQKGPAP